jgi:prevent-host-death family protein
MVVNSTEIQNNFGKYLNLASEQEIIITKKGVAVARLTGMKTRKTSIAEQLRGIIPQATDEKAIKRERMSRHEGVN